MSSIFQIYILKLFQFERQKKLEREHKRKQEASSLEETKEQIAQLEEKLSSHKTEKHELFHALKKVLYEDDTTRKRTKEAAVPYTNIYLQPTVRPAPGSLYSMKSHPQLLITSQQPQMHPQKRPRSPSPPRSAIPAGYYRQGAAPPSASSSKYPVSYSAASNSGPQTQYGPSQYARLPPQAQDERSAKHMYLSAGRSAGSASRNIYNERDRIASHLSRPLGPPSAAHSSTAITTAAAAAAAYNRPNSMMAGFPRYNLPISTIPQATLSNSPRLAYSQVNLNGSSKPSPSGGSRY